MSKLQGRIYQPLIYFSQDRTVATVRGESITEYNTTKTQRSRNKSGHNARNRRPIRRRALDVVQSEVSEIVVEEVDLNKESGICLLCPR